MGIFVTWRSENYCDVIIDPLTSFKVLGCNGSSKNSLIGLNLEFSPENLGAVNDEEGERFHQDIMYMEKRYQRKWSPSLLPGYCWTLKRDAPEAKLIQLSILELSLYIIL